MSRYMRHTFVATLPSRHTSHTHESNILTSINQRFPRILYDLSTFTRKRLVILEPKTASHYYDQSLPVIDQSLPGPDFHDQSFANHDPHTHTSTHARARTHARIMSAGRPAGRQAGWQAGWLAGGGGGRKAGRQKKLWCAT